MAVMYFHGDGKKPPQFVCTDAQVQVRMDIVMATLMIVRACAITRRTPNPTTSPNYDFFPTELAKKTRKIYFHIPSDNVLYILYLNVHMACGTIILCCCFCLGV